MIVRETVTKFATQNVVRCDKCCCKIVGREKQEMEIVVFNALQQSTAQVVQKKYHLCWRCAFNMRDDFDQRRERVRVGGVTDAEQEALLHGLFNKKKRQCR